MSKLSHALRALAAAATRSLPAFLIACPMLPLGQAFAQESAADAGHWPSFRGPLGGGVADGWDTPEVWDVEKGEGVLWRVELAGLAHSSPVIWGDRLFVTSAVRATAKAELSSLYGSPGYGSGDAVPDEGIYSFRLYCYDKNSGKLLWEKESFKGEPKVKRHPKSSHANCSPATDGKHVLAFFSSEGLYCYDMQGELLWSRDLGKLDAGAPGQRNYQWGFASSPIIVADKVIVQCDVQDQSFLAALDIETGKDLWRTERDEDSTWSTPAVHYPAEGAPRIVANGYKHIGGYDLETGKELWKLVGGGDVPVPTPVIDAERGLIFITSAHGRYAPIYAIREDAAGTLSSTAEESAGMAWRHMRRGVYMQTPLVYGEFLYCCSDGGILACYVAETGERVYRERLGSGNTGFSGSPVAAEGKLYLSGEDGTVHVVAAGPEFELYSANNLGETCMTTPAISEGVLYYKTQHHLLAIGAK